MSSVLVSQRLSALRQKLRPAAHSGQFFSADDVAGLIDALRSIERDVVAWEDRAAGERRQAKAHVPVPANVAMHGKTTLGTLIFVPAGA